MAERAKDVPFYRDVIGVLSSVVFHAVQSECEEVEISVNSTRKTLCVTSLKEKSDKLSHGRVESLQLIAQVCDCEISHDGLTHKVVPFQSNKNKNKIGPLIPVTPPSKISTLSKFMNASHPQFETKQRIHLNKTTVTMTGMFIGFPELAKPLYQSTCFDDRCIAAYRTLADLYKGQCTISIRLCSDRHSSSSLPSDISNQSKLVSTPLIKTEDPSESSDDRSDLVSPSPPYQFLPKKKDDAEQRQQMISVQISDASTETDKEEEKDRNSPLVNRVDLEQELLDDCPSKAVETELLAQAMQGFVNGIHETSQVDSSHCEECRMSGSSVSSVVYHTRSKSDDFVFIEDIKYPHKCEVIPRPKMKKNHDCKRRTLSEAMATDQDDQDEMNNGRDENHGSLHMAEQSLKDESDPFAFSESALRMTAKDIIEHSSNMSAWIDLDIQSMAVASAIARGPGDFEEKMKEEEKHRMPAILSASQILSDSRRSGVLSSVSATTNSTLRLSKNELKSLRIVGSGQVDRKWIICQQVSDCHTGDLSQHSDQGCGALFIVDQHAADERVRLEMLTSMLIEVGKTCPKRRRLQPSPLLPPLRMEGVSESKKSTITQRIKMLENWSFAFEWRSNSQRVCRDVLILTHAPRIFGSRVCRNDSELRGMIDEICQPVPLSEKYFIPACVRSALASKACRTAVKFGDHLTKRQMRELLTKLGQCSDPFHCAHGRPSIFPLCIPDHILRPWIPGEY